jgi:hypothetical protein
MRRGVQPSQVTERELADAFSASPGFADAIMQQARLFRGILAATPGSSNEVWQPFIMLCSSSTVEAAKLLDLRLGAENYSGLCMYPQRFRHLVGML